VYNVIDVALSTVEDVECSTVGPCQQVVNVQVLYILS